MSPSHPSSFGEPGLHLPTARDLLAPLFRYRRVVLLTFVFAMTVVITAAALSPRWFEAEMRFLVKRERLDPVITPANQPVAPAGFEVTQSELYSEIELLKSRDLLEQVAIATNLYKPEAAAPAAAAGGGAGERDPRLAEAVAALSDALVVQPVRNTTMIRVAYRSGDPVEAATVLERVANQYLEKHLSLRRPAGQFEFFDEQAERFERELAEAGERLLAFNTRADVTAAAGQREDTLRKLAEFEASLAQVSVEAADATRRLAALQAELKTTPDRQITQIRDAGNVEQVRSIRSQITQLNIKRDDLLQRFTERYPPVVQLEKEIAELTAVLREVEASPLRDQTTDQNPTHQWLRNEEARVRTEQEALQARAAALRRTVAEYRDRARRFDEMNVEQQELIRAQRAAETNLQLYEQKREEARIADALDQTRIANVALVDPPVVPVTPRSQRLPILAVGAVLALIVSMASAYVVHAFDPTFRTPDEVRRVLDVPVLATLPAGTNLFAKSPVRGLLESS